MIDLEAIEKRCEAATPEPWSLFDGWDNGKNAIGEPQSAVKWMGNEMSAGIRSDCGCDLYGVTADFEFIAHARQDIPLLTAEIRKLRRDVERWRDHVEQWKLASSLQVGGDPDGVTPKILEQETKKLTQQTHDASQIQRGKYDGVLAEHPDFIARIEEMRLYYTVFNRIPEFVKPEVCRADDCGICEQESKD